MNDAYAHDVGRKLCLQLCSLNGYGAASDGALDVLADLVRMFVRENSTAARSYAENAGRTDVNALDIATSLDDLGFGLEDLLEFEHDTEEIPFGVTVPKFPVKAAREEYVSFKSQKKRPPDYVPNYLPVFPAEHTYLETPLFLNKQEDEKAKALREHEAKKTTEQVLIKMEKKETEDGYLSNLLEEEEESGVGSPVSKRQRKMASNWTELLLGRLSQNEGSADMSSRLLPSTSLSSVPSFEAAELSHAVKKRKKDKDQNTKDKPGSSSAAPFSSMLEFNLTPPKQSPNMEESINENPSIETEDLSTSPGALEAVQEEGTLETEDFDIFGGDVSVAKEEHGSNDILGEEWSPLGGTQTEDQVLDETDSPIDSTESKDDV